jgi:Zn-dependent protease with chaperone function
MHVAVYLPLLFPVLTVLVAWPLAEQLPPRMATWLLSAFALLLAGCGCVALSLLTLGGLVRIPLVAALGHWSVYVVRRDDPSSLFVAVVAGVLLVIAAAAAVRMLRRRVRALIAAAADAARLPGTGDVVVVDDPAAEAFAVPGLPGAVRGPPGRIVVSTGMLAVLDTAERDVLLAHERAHLTNHHYLFVAAVQLAATVNPLLRPLAHAVAYTVERWADEHAVAVCGDRHRVAHTVGKAALAATHTRRLRVPVVSLSVLGRLGLRGPLHGAGPVPRRVAALLTPPPVRRVFPLAAVVVVLVAGGSALASLDAMHDLHAMLELAEVGTSVG